MQGTNIIDHPNYGMIATDAQSGMTLRAYAAIKLGVPDSGIDWLDDMIRKSVRDEFAGQALAGMLAWGGRYSKGFECKGAEECYKQADAMLAEREKGGGR
jgi:hypothetical protein